MGKIWLSSDLHFGHDREFIWSPRGFNSIEEHDKTIIKNWNDLVSWDDEVWLLGDCILGNNDAGCRKLNQLAGKIYIVPGNHDTATRLQMYANIRPTILVMPLAYNLKYHGYNFYLSHYPTLTSNLENSSELRRHVINLYGHTHQKTNFYEDMPFMYHVGVDSHNCTPILLDDIIEEIKIKTQECLEYVKEEDNK